MSQHHGQVPDTPRRAVFTRGRIAAGVAAVVVIGLVTTVVVLGGRTANDGPAPTAATPGPSVTPTAAVAPGTGVPVVYEVTGPGSATVTYIDANSSAVRIDMAPLPWRIDLKVPASFATARVRVNSSDPAGRYTCRVTVDGKSTGVVVGAAPLRCAQALAAPRKQP